MTRVYLVCPYHITGTASCVSKDYESRLNEIFGLAVSIKLDVVGHHQVRLKKPSAASFLGRGTIDTLKQEIKALEADLVIVDVALSPIQQRNLEKGWNCKVIDRTGLILEIFGERARTREGSLQVELARLTYERSRLVRSWTHLERQRGGTGFLGGPGESQIELDRRLLENRILGIKKNLEHVKRTRTLQRKNREKNAYPHIALVGYTNSGKSTLFNGLTGSETYADNMLFATLDPTLRAVQGPHGQVWILSDTVGFIRNLPTELVVSFRATLEEVCEAQVILHVQDVSNSEWAEQKKEVLRILDMLFKGQERPKIIDVYNKIDLISADAFSCVNTDIAVCVSALNKTNFSSLLKKIENILSQNHRVIHISLDLVHGRLLAWLYKHGQVLERTETESLVHMKVKLDEIAENRFKKEWHNQCHSIARVW